MDRSDVIIGKSMLRASYKELHVKYVIAATVKSIFLLTLKNAGLGDSDGSQAPAQNSDRFRFENLWNDIQFGVNLCSNTRPIDNGTLQIWVWALTCISIMTQSFGAPSSTPTLAFTIICIFALSLLLEGRWNQFLIDDKCDELSTFNFSA